MLFSTIEWPVAQLVWKKNLMLSLYAYKTPMIILDIVKIRHSTHLDQPWSKLASGCQIC